MRRRRRKKIRPIIATRPSIEPTTAPAIVPGETLLEVLEDPDAFATADDAELSEVVAALVLGVALNISNDEEGGAGQPIFGNVFAKPSIGWAKA